MPSKSTRCLLSKSHRCQAQVLDAEQKYSMPSEQKSSMPSTSTRCRAKVLDAIQAKVIDTEHKYSTPVYLPGIPQRYTSAKPHTMLYHRGIPLSKRAIYAKPWHTFDNLVRYTIPRGIPLQNLVKVYCSKRYTFAKPCQGICSKRYTFAKP